MEDLPQFRYHPDPIRTGMVRASGAQCQACEKVRGYIYTGNVYTAADVEHVCPWCIASGEAARKLGASFADAHQLAADGISTSIIEEVTERTPGYESWQSEVWLSRCDDACEFHGEARREDLERVDLQERARLQSKHSFSASEWDEIVRSYQPAGHPAFYKFVCRHCGTALFHVDYT